MASDNELSVAPDAPGPAPVSSPGPSPGLSPGPPPSASMWERRASALDPRVMEAAAATHHLNGEKGSRLTVPEIEERVRAGSVPQVRGEFEALQIAKGGGWEIDAMMIEKEQKVDVCGGLFGLFVVVFFVFLFFSWFLFVFVFLGGLFFGLF